MTRYQILYWHDIPIQVRAQDSDGRYSRPLPERFQVAIDKAAVEAGQTDDESYTAGFRWSEPQEKDGTAREVAEALAAELDRRYSRLDWRKTVEALTGKRTT